ncbi:calcium-dependent protein kinase 26-like protein [Tanacetum coccineum]
MSDLKRLKQFSVAGYVSSATNPPNHLLHAPTTPSNRRSPPLLPHDDVVDVRKEVEIMHHLSGHPYVVSIKGAYEDSYDVHLVMELCCGGVMRLNLKPENFLFVDKGEDSFLKAIDFGLSVFFKPGDIFTDIVGSPYYVALEVLLRHYGFEIDIRSAGGELDFSFDPWPVISESAKDLIKKMLISRRITGNEVLRYPWICVHGVALYKPLDHAVLTRLTQFFVINKLTKLALKVIASKLLGEEIVGLRKMFKMIDTDNSGCITFMELKDVLKNYGADLDKSIIRDLMLSTRPIDPQYATG